MRIALSCCLLILFIAPLWGADLNKERAAILQADKEWAAAASAGKDVEKILSFWAEDAKVYPPGMPVVDGKTAIRKFVQDSLAMPGFSISWVTNDVVVSSDGKLAYASGTNQTTFTNPEGNMVTLNGKAVTVWRKEASGEWKCVMDIWNEDPKKP